MANAFKFEEARWQDRGRHVRPPEKKVNTLSQEVLKESFGWLGRRAREAY